MSASHTHHWQVRRLLEQRLSGVPRSRRALRSGDAARHRCRDAQREDQDQTLDVTGLHGLDRAVCPFLQNVAAEHRLDNVPASHDCSWQRLIQHVADTTRALPGSVPESFPGASSCCVCCTSSSCPSPRTIHEAIFPVAPRMRALFMRRFASAIREDYRYSLKKGATSAMTRATGSGLFWRSSRDQPSARNSCLAADAARPWISQPSR